MNFCDAVRYANNIIWREYVNSLPVWQDRRNTTSNHNVTSQPLPRVDHHRPRPSSINTGSDIVTYMRVKAVFV